MIRLAGARIYDPPHGIDGVIRDLFIEGGRIVAAPRPGTHIDEEYDLAGRIVMAGAPYLHPHIGGGAGHMARSMLPEDHRDSAFARTGMTRSGSGVVAPSTFA